MNPLERNYGNRVRTISTRSQKHEKAVASIRSSCVHAFAQNHHVLCMSSIHTGSSRSGFVYPANRTRIIVSPTFHPFPVYGNIVLRVYVRTCMYEQLKFGYAGQIITERRSHHALLFAVVYTPGRAQSSRIDYSRVYDSGTFCDACTARYANNYRTRYIVPFEPR